VTGESRYGCLLAAYRTQLNAILGGVLVVLTAASFAVAGELALEVAAWFLVRMLRA
jgi:hypothetical protein